MKNFEVSDHINLIQFCILFLWNKPLCSGFTMLSDYICFYLHSYQTNQRGSRLPLKKKKK